MNSSTSTPASHPVVSPGEWLRARKALLEKEQEYARLGKELCEQRLRLPWVKVTKQYTFDTPLGKATLADLFEGRSQLIIYHFMFGPGWKEGCHGCSFLADHIDAVNMHLKHHDVTIAVVSRAPIREIEPFKKRMGWDFTWASSYGSDFNYDFQVTATKEELANRRMYHNYEIIETSSEEHPGVSVFFRDDNGEVYHTYSTFDGTVELVIGSLQYLDLAPKGRNETTPMDWVRHHDRYED